MGGDRDTRIKRLGVSGEDLACRMLLDRGYELLERNFRSGHKEVDIICRDGDDIRFVEVKARKEPVEGEPWEAVTPAKQRRIGRVAAAYLSFLSAGGRPSLSDSALHFCPGESHFDIVSIVWDRDGRYSRAEYIEDAYCLIFT